MTDLDNPTEQVRVKYVRITNGLDIPFSDRHDGVPVKVNPGETKNLPIDMAAHFFGPVGIDPAATFRHVSRRQGWNTPKFLETDESGKSLAQRMFDKLKIEAVMYKLVQVEQDPSAPIPADPQPLAQPATAAPRRVQVSA